MSEKIFKENFRTVTQIVGFGTDFDYTKPQFDQAVSEGLSEAYLTFDKQGRAQDIFLFNGENIYSRTNENNFVPIEESSVDYITGHSLSKTLNVLLEEGDNDSQYVEKFKRIASVLSDGKSNTFVFKKNISKQDYYINVGLERKFNSIDTLNVYNNLINGMPEQESETGVVFGRLMANQKITDRNNNPIQIPLRDVPVGIFQPSDTFPTISSRDESGNRIRMNYLQNNSIFPPDFDYYNDRSSNFDEQFLLSSADFERIPDHYKITTKTNENGEFILYDVPVGTQTLFFEVNLLKQGLTKEEVSLNFFPYPNVENPNIDSVPHFFFRQFPIDVVPAWGTLQTGYTEVDINVNLDLRKWTTYFFPPISIDGNNLDELRTSRNAKVNINIRDMTKDGFGGQDIENLPQVSLVEVPDPINRNLNQELEWRDEFVQSKNTAEFRSDDFSILKLPANIYSPNIVSTSELNKQRNSLSEYGAEYNPKNGTWFSAYQFNFTTNMFSDFYRATGFHKVSDTEFTDHFRLNRHSSNSSEFPYERSWDSNYPDEIKIPQIPSERYALWGGANYGDESKPKYRDGDLVGQIPSDKNSGGWGLQRRGEFGDGDEFSNRFSKRVTKSFCYKYEFGVSEHERYANGYQPHKDSKKLSIVKNGEKFQRLEAGEAYFMKCKGWSDVFYYTWGDAIKIGNTYDYPDSKTGVDVQPNLNLTLKVGPNSPEKKSGIDIYRIVNPDPINVLSPDPEITPTSLVLNTYRIYRRRRDTGGSRTVLGYAQESQRGARSGVYFFPHRGSAISYFTSFSIEIVNRGTKSVDDPFSPNATLEPGESRTHPISETMPQSGELGRVQLGLKYTNKLNNMRIPLEGNDDFDPENFIYRKANYQIIFKDFSEGSEGGLPYQQNTLNINDEALEQPKEIWAKSRFGNAKTNLSTGNNRRCVNNITNRNNDSGIKAQGIILGTNATLYASEGQVVDRCGPSFDNKNQEDDKINISEYYFVGIEKIKLVRWNFAD